MCLCAEREARSCSEINTDTPAENTELTPHAVLLAMDTKKTEKAEGRRWETEAVLTCSPHEAL